VRGGDFLKDLGDDGRVDENGTFHPPHRSMNLPFSRFSRLAFSILAAAVVWTLSATAQTTPGTSVRELKIVGGKILDVSKTVQPVPATLSNVVDILRDVYREATITVVGVDDLVIDNITLRIAPRTAGREGALRIALAALAEASGRKFRVQEYSPQEFMLSAERSPAGHLMAEVFNLGPLLSNTELKQLERQVREVETALAATRKVMTNEHPRVAELNIQLEILKATKGQAGVGPESKKVIDQIKETVAITLDLMKSAEKQPQFQFHPGTNLLIVVGGDDTIEVTRKIVAALEKGAN
jgi:hypothetical protein